MLLTTISIILFAFNNTIYIVEWSPF